MLMPSTQDVEVPGGQRIYVFPTGALAYTPAHAPGESSVNNGTTAGFVYVNGTEAGQLGSLTFQGGDWLACPVEGGEGAGMLLFRLVCGFFLWWGMGDSGREEWSAFAISPMLHDESAGVLY